MTIYRPKSSGATTLLSADGSTLLTDKEAILKRWREPFYSVLNRPSSINEDAIDILPQIECNVLLDEFPTALETRKAVQQLSSGRAPGAGAIPAQVHKAGGLLMTEKLLELFHCMWRKEAIPQEFKDTSIIHQYKRKGWTNRHRKRKHVHTSTRIYPQVRKFWLKTTNMYTKRPPHNTPINCMKFHSKMHTIGFRPTLHTSHIFCSVSLSLSLSLCLSVCLSLSLSLFLSLIQFLLPLSDIGPPAKGNDC